MGTRSVFWTFVMIVCLSAGAFSADGDTDPKAKSSADPNATNTPGTDKGVETTAQEQIKSLKAVTLLDPPFMMRTATGIGWSGYLYDILTTATKNIGYDAVDLSLQDEAQYGFEEKPGLWKGMIGDLQNGTADLAVASLSVSSQRSKVIDYTQPVLHGGFRVLYKIPDSWHPGPAMVTLLKPFTPGLWVLIVLMFVMTSLGLYVIGRYSPYEDVAFVGKTATYDGLTLPNSLLYTFSSLVWQGYTSAPKSISGRFLACVWWVFSVLTVGAYIAGLVVILFTTDPEIRTLPFTTLDEMTRQSKVGLLVVQSSTTHAYLTNHPGKLESRIRAMININKEESLVKSVPDGLKKMMDTDGKWALLMDGPAAEYLANQKPCDKIVLGETLSDHTYSFACRKNTDVCSKMDTEILAMKEKGTLDKLRQKWFHSGCEENRPKAYVYEGLPFFDTFGGEPDAISPRTITIKRFSSAFLILAVGIVIAGVCLVVEIYYAKRRGTAVPRRMDRGGRDDDMERIDNEFHDERA